MERGAKAAVSSGPEPFDDGGNKTQTSLCCAERVAHPGQSPCLVAGDKLSHAPHFHIDRPQHFFFPFLVVTYLIGKKGYFLKGMVRKFRHIGNHG